MGATSLLRDRDHQLTRSRVYELFSEGVHVRQTAERSLRVVFARASSMMVLICYDGSAEAQAAIDGVGTLMPGSDAAVLTVWDEASLAMTRLGNGPGNPRRLLDGRI